MELHHGASNNFGHADWYAAQARGMTPTQIANWVRANTHTIGRGTASAVYADVMAAEASYNAQQARIQADNAARRAAIAAQQKAQQEAEAARQKQMEENEKARQQLLEEEKRAQEHQQQLADERAATAEIAASNQNLGGGSGNAPENKGWGGFGASFQEDPTKKFRTFDGTNFGSKSDSKAKGTGWKEGSLELTKQSRDPIESSIKTGTLIYSQRGTGKDKVSTEEMNNSLFSDAKERAQKWTVGYGKRFG